MQVNLATVEILGNEKMKNKIKTFNPGPSQISPRILQHISEMSLSGFLSLSHRSAIFSETCRKAIEGLYENMQIPKNYLILFQPSATVSMDTVLRNLVYSHSYHFVHGAFSQRFFKTANELGLNAACHETPWNKAIHWEEAKIPLETELLAITQNETSSGLMWPSETIENVRIKYPKPLLAIDATSSFSSLRMNWHDADIWFASVQKCLGLPSGLALIILSPKAFEKSKELLKKKGGVASWQNFESMAKKMEAYQTIETPNMFAIALLAEQMKSWDLEKIESYTLEKAHLIYQDKNIWTPYVDDPAWRSPTVLNLTVKNPDFLHRKAHDAGFVLGKGYGKLKESCIRIANFPSVSREMLRSLFDALVKG